jgi:hypothetical protein
MGGGLGAYPLFILGVVALGLVGVLTLGVYLMTRKTSADGGADSGGRKERN